MIQRQPDSVIVSHLASADFENEGFLLRAELRISSLVFDELKTKTVFTLAKCTPNYETMLHHDNQ